MVTKGHLLHFILFQKPSPLPASKAYGSDSAFKPVSCISYRKMHLLWKFSEDKTTNNLDMAIKGYLLQKF